jgi:hypothetical protein
MRVCVRAYIGEPGPCVFKTYSSREFVSVGFLTGKAQRTET